MLTRTPMEAVMHIYNILFSQVVQTNHKFKVIPTNLALMT
jgi:hypothetical protein